MATRDHTPQRTHQPDPQEVLAAAEAAHLAARRTVPIAPRPEPTQQPESVQPDRPAEPAPAPRRPADDRRPRRAPLPLAAGVAAGWAAVVTFVPVAAFAVLLQAAEAGPLAVAGPVRVAAAGWLLSHGVPVRTAGGSLSLAPLALSALAAWRVARAGVHVTRALGARNRGSVRQALRAAGAVAVGYAAIGAVLAVAGGQPAGALPRVVLTLAGFGFLAAWYGSLRTTGVLARWLDRVPPALWLGAKAGVIAAMLVLATGAAVAGVAIAGNGGPAADILAAYGTDVAGQAGLTVLCAAYAPNLAGWAAAYLVGPGFAVGTDTVVRSSEVTVGPLPALPVFAGLPESALPTVGAVLLAVPVVAGAIAGWLVGRGGTGWTRPLLGALVSGVVAGAALGLVAAASGGSVAAGRLAEFGPDPVLVAGFSTATVMAGALASAAATALLTRRRDPRSS
ncbi:MAG TPA: DUF6350 family protein [Natronosporangium sp.]